MAPFTRLIEAPHFQAAFEPVDQTLRLSLSGFINEDVDFGKVLELLSSLVPGIRMVSFELGGVHQINSCGIREWLFFLEKVQTQLKLGVRFEMISETFIEQANIIPSLLGSGKATVDKFAAPYSCPRCKTREPRSIAPSQVQHADGKYNIPAFSCAQCKGVLEFDTFEGEYFIFFRKLA